MRAVSLSNVAVKKLLNQKFVCTWVNIASDPAAGSSHPHPCTDQARDMARGLGEHNTQTLILTPDGRLLTVLAGYIGPSDLLEELKFAAALWEKVRKTTGPNRKKLMAKAHTAFAGQLARRKGKPGLTGLEEQFFGQLKAVGNKRGVADHQFSARSPLLPASRFTTALMVGNAKTAFVSQTNGTGGNLDAPGLLPKWLLQQSGKK